MNYHRQIIKYGLFSAIALILINLIEIPLVEYELIRDLSFAKWVAMSANLSIWCCALQTIDGQES